MSRIIALLYLDVHHLGLVYLRLILNYPYGIQLLENLLLLLLIVLINLVVSSSIQLPQSLFIGFLNVLSTRNGHFFLLGFGTSPWVIIS